MYKLQIIEQDSDNFYSFELNEDFYNIKYTKNIEPILIIIQRDFIDDSFLKDIFYSIVKDKNKKIILEYNDDKLIELNNINMDLTSYLLKTEDNKLIEILLLYS